MVGKSLLAVGLGDPDEKARQSHPHARGPHRVAAGHELALVERPSLADRNLGAAEALAQNLAEQLTRNVPGFADALAESLAELEALTAADGGESGGAALVVMGDARLVQFLPDPQLTRLAQRLHPRTWCRTTASGCPR